MANLLTASYQWSNRPPDERFASLQAMRRATFDHFSHSTARDTQVQQLRVEHIEGDLQIVGRKGVPTRFTHYSFGQLCQWAEAPASYLRRLPATLAAQNLNVGLKRLEQDRNLSILLHHNGVWRVQAFLSQVYQRIWNYQVVDWLMDLPKGWRVPPARPAVEGQPGTKPATEDDVLNDHSGGFGLSVKIGDMIAPAGLYASDHDMFAFLVNEGQSLEAASGGRETLSRGFFIRNSEVGDSELELVCFLYEHVCGNHIVWGATKVERFGLRHVGKRARSFAGEISSAVDQMSRRSGQEDLERVRAARKKLLGETREEVIDLVFSHGIFSRKRAEDVYAMADQYSDVHGDPKTAWGYMSGATRLSQQVQFADERNQIDRAARRVLEMAWR